MITVLFVPIAHFFLLKTRIPSFLVSSFILGLLVVYPLIWRDFESEFLTPYAFAIRLTVAVASLGVIFEPFVAKQLNFVEFLTFFISQRLPLRYTQKVSKKSLLEQKSLPWDKVDLISLSFTMLAEYLVYCSVMMYHLRWEQDWMPDAYNFTFSDIIKVYFLGLALSGIMDVVFQLVLVCASFVFNIKHYRIMDNVFLSQSVGEFWSKRWNLLYQAAFFRFGYLPILKALHSGNSKLSKEWQKSIAVFGTFCLSGIVHELVCFGILNDYRNNPSFEQLLFFLLHGLLVIFEASIGKRFKNSLPWWLNMLGTNVIVAFTGPFFMNPFIREKIYFKTLLMPKTAAA